MEADRVAEDRAFAERITEVYWLRVRDTGLGQARIFALRAELGRRVEECLGHFQRKAPQEVAKVARVLKRYDKLRDTAGIDRRLLEEPSKLLPGVFGHLQAVVEALLGFLPALIGFVTGVIPYAIRRRLMQGIGDDRRSASAGVLVTSLVFGLFYGALVLLVALRYSREATVLAAILLLTTGPFAIAYIGRMRTIVAHIGGRAASWFKLDAVRRVREAQDELVTVLDGLRDRYRREVLGWESSPRRSRRRATIAALRRVAAISALIIAAALFANAYIDQPIRGLPLGPSPWQETRLVDPQEAERELLRDAVGVLLAAEQLNRLQDEMSALRERALVGAFDFLTQADQDSVRVLMLAYLDLRSALLKTVWLYRGEDELALDRGNDALEDYAFLTAYAAAALLAEKAWVIYDTFQDDDEVRGQLDLPDLAWGVPPGTYTMLAESLTSRTDMAELELATRRFDAYRAAGVTLGAPWDGVAQIAEAARPALEQVFDGIGRRRLELTLSQMVAELSSPVGEITPMLSLAISRFRFKERPPHRGLISTEQLAELREVMRPGDILIERRNWFISNSVLPGFWPHAALYLGSYEELAALGLVSDQRAEPHLGDFQGENELGDPYAVIEAIGEGVIFTSLEHSVGEADAVAVLRPNLSDEALREALARALSHHGKEYDFDFDFETTDRLVCTELIFRTYDGTLDIPEMRQIMGKPRITASDYVSMWAEGRGSADPQLEFVRFLDFDEANGISIESDEESLIATLERSRFTFLN